MGGCQRVRTRPTRDDTRDKLFEGAARVFEEQGIGGVSIEAIAAAAGFTRGAFYSNFESKEELIIAMLEDHVEQSIRHCLSFSPGTRTRPISSTPFATWIARGRIHSAAPRSCTWK